MCPVELVRALRNTCPPHLVIDYTISKNLIHIHLYVVDSPVFGAHGVTGWGVGGATDKQLN